MTQHSKTRQPRLAVSRVDFYPDDWLAGTSELSAELRGVFITIVALYYSKQGRVPDHDRWLAGVCNMSMRRWRSIKEQLISIGKISVADGFIFQERAEIELENALKAKDSARESGRLGGLKSAELRARALKRNNPPPSNPSTDAQATLQASLVPPPPSPPPNKERKSVFPDLDKAFELLWLAYPRKTGSPKQAAWKHYQRITKNGNTPETIHDACMAYAATVTDKTFMPYLRTVLSEERWKEFVAAPPPELTPEQQIRLDRMKALHEAGWDQERIRAAGDYWTTPDDVFDALIGGSL